MTPEMLHILQHSLGVDQYGRGTQYRNRYVIGPDSDEFLTCQLMAIDGLLKDHGPQTIAGGMHCFTVTEIGKREMTKHSPAPPKLTRSQERYRRWLKADCGLTFRDFLKIKPV